MSEFRRTGERLVHQGYVWRVVVAEFEAPDGSAFTRDIVRSPGAVGIVPLLPGDGSPDDPDVVLLRQWRPPYEAVIWEIPAGMRDVPGEPPEVTAGRELVEEAGFRAARVELLTNLYPSPGMTDSVTWIFAGMGLTPTAQDLHGPEEEHLVVERFALSEAVAMIERGEIRDAKTVTGLLLAERGVRAGTLRP